MKKIKEIDTKAVQKILTDLHKYAMQHYMWTHPSAKNIVMYREVLNNKKLPFYLFIGEAPGFKENEIGLPFVGKSGELLTKWCKENNIENYGIINAVPIIPLNKFNRIRPPTEEEIEYFRFINNLLIDELKPDKIVCIGKTAMNAMKLNLGNGEWTKIKPFTNEYKIGLMYHPAYYLRNGNTGIEASKKHFKRLLENER